jgi:hypothetical protein
MPFGAKSNRPGGRAFLLAKNWACRASLIETCKLNSVNPRAYFTDLPTCRPARATPFQYQLI